MIGAVLIADLVHDDLGLEFWEVLFTGKVKVFGLVEGAAFLTGWILDVILAVMFVCSMPFVRRRGHFQVNSTFVLIFLVYWFYICTLMGLRQ